MMTEDSIEELVAEAERLTGFETQSSKAHALRSSGEIGDCKIYVVNFTERYATMYTKDAIKALELKGSSK